MALLRVLALSNRSPHPNTVLRGPTLSLLFKARPLADTGGGSAFFRDPSLRFAALGALHVGAPLYLLLSHWIAFLKNASPACPVLCAPCGSAEVLGVWVQLESSLSCVLA